MTHKILPGLLALSLVAAAAFHSRGDIACDTDPVAVDDSVNTDDRTTVVVDLLANDSNADGAPLEAIIVHDDCAGEFALNTDNTLTYRPLIGVAENCSVTYTARAEGTANSANAVAHITVEAGSGGTYPNGAYGLPSLDPQDDRRLVTIDGSEVRPLNLVGYYPGLHALTQNNVNLSDPVGSTYYRELIDLLADRGINLLRTFLTWNTAIEDDPLLQPYLRSSQCCTAHGTLLGSSTAYRYDLDQFNPDFFAYWDAVVAYAEERGVVMQINIIDTWHTWGSRSSTCSPANSGWEKSFQGPIVGHTYTAGRRYDFFAQPNNVNGIDTDNGGADSGSPCGWYTDPAAVAKQTAYFRRVVQELGDHPNIIWEIGNEPFVDTNNDPLPEVQAWIDAMTAVVEQEEAAAGYARHLVIPRDLPEHRKVPGSTLPGSSSDFRGFHNQMVARFDASTAPLISDNDCCVTSGTAADRRRKAWTTLVSGGYPSVFDFVADDVEAPLTDPTVQTAISHVGLAGRFLATNQIDLLGMEPSDELLSGASADVWLLARPGDTYLVYYLNGGTATVQGLPTPFDASWFDPRQGVYSPAGSGATFVAPSGDDWVLLITADDPMDDARITSDPSDLSVAIGGSAVFTVVAEPSGALTYQWLVDGDEITDGPRISGSSTASLTISDVQAMDQGRYSCRVTATTDGSTATSNGAVLTVLDLSLPTVEDHFDLDGVIRVAGAPLDGTQTEQGGRIWSARPQAIFGDSGGGHVTHVDTPGESLQVVGGVTFEPSLAPTGQIAVEAEVQITGQGWAAIGFSRSATGGYFGSGGHGQVWMLIREDGSYEVHVDGSGNEPPLATGVATDFVNGGFNRLRVAYRPTEQTASAWIGFEHVLDEGPLPAGFGAQVDISHAGFHLNVNGGGDSGRLKLDDFLAEADSGGSNQPPVAVADALTTSQGTTLRFTSADLLANDYDPDGDPIEFVPPPSDPPEGSVVFAGLNGGQWNYDYTPRPGFVGTDTFTYTIRDDQGLTDTGTVTVTVTQSNLPPVAVADALTTGEGTTLRFTSADLLANDYDPEGGTIEFVPPPSDPPEGSVVFAGLNGGQWNYDYTPRPGFVGADIFTYTIRDDQGLTDTGTVTVTVTESNQPPVAVTDALTTTQGTALRFTDADLLANDYDPDGDPIEFVPPPSNPPDGSVVFAGLNGGRWNYDYTPEPDFVGVDTFTYTIRDEHGLTATGVVNVTVTANQVPVAVEDHFVVPAGQGSFEIPVAALLANDTDPEGDALELAAFGDPAFGSLVDQGGTLVFQPEPIFWEVGVDAFTYTVREVDRPANTSTALVHLRVWQACDSWFADGFEGKDLAAWSGVQITGGGTVAADAAAALVGTQGLAVTIASDSVYLWVTDTSPVDERHYRAGFAIDPNSLTMAVGDSFTLFSAFRGSDGAFSLQARRAATGYQIGLWVLDNAGAYTFGPWIDLADDPQSVYFDWWAASAPGLLDGGARLWVDHQLVTELSALDNDSLAVEDIRLGALYGMDPGTSGTFYLDAFESCGGEMSRQDLLWDGFESGLGAWTDVAIVGGGNVQATASAALAGSQGLEVTVDGTSQNLWVHDATPDAENHYLARFLFDPASLSMASGDSHPVFQGYGGSGAPFTLHLRPSPTVAGAFQLSLWLVADDGSYRFGPWVDLANGTREILVEWWAATDPSVSDGGGRLWIDSVGVTEMTDVTNGGTRLDGVRLGAVFGVDAGTSGSYHFDAFASWRGRRSVHMLLDDDFETGSLGAWDGTTVNGPGTVLVVPATNGSAYLLKVVIAEGSQNLWALDATPSAGENFGLEVRFDPASIAMAAGNEHTILQAIGEGSTYTLHLRFFGGVYQIGLWADLDGGGHAFGAWTDIDDLEQTLRIDWRRATAPGVADGAARLWSDGVLLNDLQGLQNAEQTVDAVRLGAVYGMDSQTVGPYTFDDYRSWN